jgi:hypothetical protein
MREPYERKKNEKLAFYFGTLFAGCEFVCFVCSLTYPAVASNPPVAGHHVFREHDEQRKARPQIATPGRSAEQKERHVIHRLAVTVTRQQTALTL